MFDDDVHGSGGLKDNKNDKHDEQQSQETEQQKGLVVAPQTGEANLLVVDNKGNNMDISNMLPSSSSQVEEQQRQQTQPPITALNVPKVSELKDQNESELENESCISSSQGTDTSVGQQQQQQRRRRQEQERKRSDGGSRGYHSTTHNNENQSLGTTTATSATTSPPLLVTTIKKCCYECYRMLQYMNVIRNRCINHYVRNNILLEDNNENDEGHYCSNLSKRWNNFTYNSRWYIILFWLCIIWPIGIFCYPRFTQSTNSEFQPLPNSLSSNADIIYKSSYNVPSTIRLPVIILLEQIIDNNTNTTTNKEGQETQYGGTTVQFKDIKNYNKWDGLDFSNIPSSLLLPNSNHQYPQNVTSFATKDLNHNEEEWWFSQQQHQHVINDTNCNTAVVEEEDYNTRNDDDDNNNNIIDNISLIDGHSELYNSTRDFVFCLTEHLEELIYRYGPNPDTTSSSAEANNNIITSNDNKFSQTSPYWDEIPPDSQNKNSTIINTLRSRRKRQLLSSNKVNNLGFGSMHNDIEEEKEEEDQLKIAKTITTTTTTTTTNTVPPYIKVSNYYETERRGLHILAKNAYASQSGQYTYIKIDYATPTLDDMRNFLLDLTTYATDNCPNGVNVSFTGIHFFQDDILQGAKTDVKHMDSIVLPLALIVLAFVLGSNLPIMIIPLLTIISATLLSAIIMYPIASYVMQVTQFTQSLMSSLVISMSIDYSLFLLARCIEEVNRQQKHQQQHGITTTSPMATTDELLQERQQHQNGTEGEQEQQRQTTHWKHCAIGSMLEYSGHTIIASGITLCCCFLGLLFLPLAMLRSVGVGSSVAILSSLLVNLSLVPAILHTCIGSHMLRRPQNIILRWLCCTCCCSNMNDDVIDDYSNSKSTCCCCCFQRRGRWNQDQYSIIGGGADVFFDDDDTGLSQALIRCREEDDNDLNEVEYMELISTNSFTPGIGGEGHLLQLKNNDMLDIRRMKRSMWYQFGSKVLVHPIKGTCLLFVLLLIIIPISLYYPQCGSSISFDPMLPSNSISYSTFKKLGSIFGDGSLFPYHIIFDGRNVNVHTDTVTSFDVIKTTIHQLQQLEPTTNLTSFTGITTLGGYMIPHWLYEASILCGNNCWFEPMRTISSISYNQFNALHNMTTYVQVILHNIDPNSHNGTEWLINARHIIQGIQTNTTLNPQNLSIYLEGGSSIEYDAVKAVYDHVPLMIIITLSVVFILMGIFFRSLIVPIRSIITISITQTFVFGLAVLVYQYGILNKMGITWKAVSYAEEISWLPPVISFCVMVGLGLDYDVFLSSRVLEYRLKGLSDQSSILVGLYKTGRIITAAGIIMAIAFGGLLGSTSLILNETAFLLTTAVLMDTFVTRTIVMPILMNLCGRLNWYPRKLPPIKYDVTL